MYDCHTHTFLCNHAAGLPGEYAAVASRKGLRGVAATCHSPLPPDWRCGYHMDFEELAFYVDAVREAQRRWKGRTDIVLGMECDFAPGLEPWIEKLLSLHDFEFVLGSIHPFNPLYRESFYTGNVREFQEIYFRHLALAAKSGFFHALSHPDIVKNLFPSQWRVKEVLPVIEEALDEVAAAGVALELNTSGLLKDYPEMNPGLAIMIEARKREIPFTIGSDAHAPESVAASFPIALRILSQVGYEEVFWFKNGKRYGQKIEEARKELTKRDQI